MQALQRLRGSGKREQKSNKIFDFGGAQAGGDVVLVSGAERIRQCGCAAIVEVGCGQPQGAQRGRVEIGATAMAILLFGGIPGAHIMQLQVGVQRWWVAALALQCVEHGLAAREPHRIGNIGGGRNLQYGHVHRQRVQFRRDAGVRAPQCVMRLTLYQPGSYLNITDGDFHILQLIEVA